MTIELFAHPLSSYCWKVMIAFHENATPYVLRELEPGGGPVSDEFRALWPIGKMPLVREGEQVVSESSVIVEWLDVHHPGPVRFVPADPDAALRVRHLDRVLDNYVSTAFQQIVFDRIRPEEDRSPAGVRDARAMLKRALDWLEGEVSGRRWGAGEDFTLVDCNAAPALFYADKVQPFGGDYPVLSAWLERLKARPSVARVLADAAPYFALFPSE